MRVGRTYHPSVFSSTTLATIVFLRNPLTADGDATLGARHRNNRNVFGVTNFRPLLTQECSGEGTRSTPRNNNKIRRGAGVTRRFVVVDYRYLPLDPYSNRRHFIGRPPPPASRDAYGLVRVVNLEHRRHCTRHQRPWPFSYERPVNNSCRSPSSVHPQRRRPSSRFSIIQFISKYKNKHVLRGYNYKLPLSSAFRIFPLFFFSFTLYYTFNIFSDGPTLFFNSFIDVITIVFCFNSNIYYEQ